MQVSRRIHDTKITAKAAVNRHHGRGVAVEQGGDEHDQRHEEQAALPQRFPQGGDLRWIEAGESEAQRAEMHLRVDADIIKERRQYRGDGDVAIFDAGILGHDEGGRAHHRRHDATAGRGRDLNGAGDRRLVAEPLHHRDGDRRRW